MTEKLLPICRSFVYKTEEDVRRRSDNKSKDKTKLNGFKDDLELISPVIEELWLLFRDYCRILKVERLEEPTQLDNTSSAKPKGFVYVDKYPNKDSSFQEVEKTITYTMNQVTLIVKNIAIIKINLNNLYRNLLR